jgi:predicted transcriptional regulator
MSPISNFFVQGDGRALLLSVQPRFASQIVAGSKRVEFRRVWAAQDVDLVAIYSTAPASSLVAVAAVGRVIKGSKTMLWRYAREFGGGLTRSELFEYFKGLSVGYAILFDEIRPATSPIDLRERFRAFRPPQSFRYLKTGELRLLRGLIV